MSQARDDKLESSGLEFRSLLVNESLVEDVIVLNDDSDIVLLLAGLVVRALMELSALPKLAFNLSTGLDVWALMELSTPSKLFKLLCTGLWALMELATLWSSLSKDS